MAVSTTVPSTRAVSVPAGGLKPRLNAKFEISIERLEGNIERLEVTMERSFHEQSLKIGKLTEFQVTLMESQNGAWQAIDQLARKMDRLLGFQAGNGA